MVRQLIWKNCEQQVLRSKQLLHLKRIYSKPVSLYFHVSSILVLDLPCQSHFPTFSQYSSLLRLIVCLYFWFSFCHKMMVFHQMRSREESCLKSCCNIACCSASFCCLGHTQKQCRSKSNLMCKQYISQAHARDLIFLNFIC